MSPKKLNKFINKRIISLIEFGRTGHIVDWNEDFFVVQLDGENDKLYYNREDFYFGDQRAIINPKFLQPKTQSCILNQMQKSVCQARKEVSEMAPEQRQEFYTRGLNIVYPNGYWKCHCMKSCGAYYLVGVGEKCKYCGSREVK